MTGRIEFTVLGKPQPAGSKRAFVVKGRPVVADDNRKSKPWQALVAAAASDAMDGHDPMVGPLLLNVEFYVARPAGHFGSGRNAETIRKSAPTFPITRPDTTKLLRGLEDALTGLVWRDDAQVVSQLAHKAYGSPERAEILVASIHVDGALGDLFA